jgi:hypothetical protein
MIIHISHILIIIIIIQIYNDSILLHYIYNNKKQQLQTLPLNEAANKNKPKDPNHRLPQRKVSR